MKRLPLRFDNDRFQKFWEHLSTREYCQWATPYLSRLRTPLGVLSLAAAASLLCGLFVTPQGFAVFAAILAVVGIGCAWPWIGIRGVSCQLQFTSPRTEEGKPVELQLAITNRWPWPVWGLAVEGGFSPQEAEEEEAQIAVSRVGGWSRGHYQQTFTPTLRGRYPIGKPQLVTEFPFGLWKARRPIEVTSSLLVWPERFTLPPIAMSCGTQSWVGQPTDCTTGTIGHRTTVREFQRGDSMRQIHWAKTALYDKLVSYEREGLAISDAVVSLDSHPSLHKGSGPQSSIECTIRIAASICEALLHQGVSLTVYTHAGQFRALSRGSDLTSLLDWFALFDARDGKVSHAKARPRSNRFTNSLVVHITTDLSTSFSGDSIVYLTNPERCSSANGNHTPGSWIQVRDSADIPSQIRNGWRNGPRSVRHAI